jgi:F420-non-reducing hydrogenase small subunit
VIGLANWFTARQLLECAYRQVPSMVDTPGPLPGVGKDGPPLPGLLPLVKALDQVVTVDAIVPGCPPPPATMARVIDDAIRGRLPAERTVFAHRKALCHACPRLDSRPEKIEITRFKRLHQTRWDPDVCFLPQGLICLGPVTRGGCGAQCIGANMPCRGCFGPTERVDDFGAGAITGVAAMMAGTDEAELTQLVDSIADPAGLFYRYCLAAHRSSAQGASHDPTHSHRSGNPPGGPWPHRYSAG